MRPLAELASLRDSWGLKDPAERMLWRALQDYKDTFLGMPISGYTPLHCMADTVAGRADYLPVLDQLVQAGLLEYHPSYAPWARVTEQALVEAGLVRQRQLI